MRQMVLYVVLGLLAALVGVWVIGFVASAIIDALRPREAPASSDPNDRLETVRRLTEEWESVRHHWVKDPDSDSDRGSRAA